MEAIFVAILKQQQTINDFLSSYIDSVKVSSPSLLVNWTDWFDGEIIL